MFPSHDPDAQLYISGVQGAVELNTPFASFGINYYTITVVDADNFILDGINFSALSPYTLNTGTWSVVFASGRYLSLNIFVDPRYINSSIDQSITCNIIENRSAQVVGNQNNVNTINVKAGHTFVVSNIAQFYDIYGVNQQRVITGTSPTSITVDGPAVSVLDGLFINQFI